MSATTRVELLRQAALSVIMELAERRAPDQLFYSGPSSSGEGTIPDGQQVTSHVAHCVEMMFARGGSMEVVTPGQVFHLVPGSLLLVDVGVEHGEKRSQTPEAVFIGIHGTNAQVDRVDPRHLVGSLTLIGRTDLMWVVDGLRQELSSRDPGFHRAVHGLLEYLSFILSRRVDRGSHVDTAWVWPHEVASSSAWQAMRRAMSQLAARFREDLDLSEVAESVGYSSSHLNRFFTRCLGKTMSKWLRDLRVAHGRDLLLHSDMTLVEIARASGYSDPASFRRAFESVMGTKLKGYRASVAKGRGGADLIAPRSEPLRSAPTPRRSPGQSSPQGAGLRADGSRGRQP